MSDDSRAEIDRWRMKLEEAERELVESEQAWDEKLRSMTAAMTKLSRLFDSKRENQVAETLRRSIKDQLDLGGLNGAVEQLMRLRLADEENAIASENSVTTTYGDELRELLQRVSLPKHRDEQAGEFIERLEQVNDQQALLSVLDEVVDFFDAILKSGNNSSAQVCATVVAEVLVQLMERLSIPMEVGDRLERLHNHIQAGVEKGSWGNMLEEVADMAADIRSKINQERGDIERFLKNVTERLNDVSSYLGGSERKLKQVMDDGVKLDVAVSKEMKGMQASVDSSKDISHLKVEINQYLENISNHVGVFREVSKEHQHDAEEEVRQLRQRLLSMEEETKELRARIQQTRLQSMVDPLTGINNRLAYEERIAQEFARWKRFNHPVCLAVWDVDHFKNVNDTYGHVAGDNALRSVAKILSDKIRETDFLARYGGEEYVLLMPGAPLDDAVKVAEKLRQSVEKASFRFHGKPVNITISCGIAEFRQGDTPVSVFERADKALYEAKSGGRNRIVAYSDKS